MAIEIETVDAHNVPRIKYECGRCGIVQLAEFCTDCRMVDPKFCSGGKTARELATLRAERFEKERALNDMLYVVSRKADSRARARHAKRQREATEK